MDRSLASWSSKWYPQIAKLMGPTWGPPGSCWPQMGPMLAPWTLLSGSLKLSPEFAEHLQVQWWSRCPDSARSQGISTHSISLVFPEYCCLSNIRIDILIHWVPTWESRARFLSLAQSKLRLCSANPRPGYWSNLSCDWPSTAWAYSEQETENGP